MNKSLGQIAYEAYCASRNWKSVRGDSLPQWENQGSDIANGWEAAASAVETEVLQRVAAEQSAKPVGLNPIQEE